MKKRLLSAALALAMMLTMLPMTVFAAAPKPIGNNTATDSDPGLENGTTTVAYEAKPDSNKDGVVAPGWYRYWTQKGTPNVRHYVEVTSGVINGVSTSGTWYTDPNSTTNGNPLTSFTLLGNVTLNVNSKSSSLNVDLNGHDLTVTGDEANLTSLTVNDKKWYAGQTKGTLNWAISRTTDLNADGNRDQSKNLSVTATNVSIPSITLSNWATHTVRLTNCDVGAITLSGKSDWTSSQNLTLDRCTLTGAVTVTGNNSRVAVTDTTGNQDVVLNGAGATLTVGGVSAIKDVTLTATTDSSKKTAAAPTVTVNGGTVAKIAGNSGEQSGNPYKVNVNAQGSVTAIESGRNGYTLAVNQGTVGNCALGTVGYPSSVTITGPRARVGNLNFAEGNKSSLKVSGTNNTVGIITCAAAVNMTVDIAAEPTNVFGQVTLTGYTGGGIKGGKFAGGVQPDSALSSSLVYYLVKNGQVCYYSLAQLSTALDDQTDPDTMDLAIVGQDISGTKSTITFQNGTMVWGKLTYHGQSAINLPTEVNGKKIQNWTATIGSDVVNTYPAGGRYLTPSPDNDIVMNAQSASADATKITNVTVDSSTENNVRVSLNGNVFTLSGAVTSTAGFARIVLKLTTDLIGNNGEPITANVPVLFNNGITTFGNAQLPNGMVITPDFNSLRLSNDVTYTLNGSGLKAIASLLQTDLASTEIQATANISGWTQAQKDALIDALSDPTNTAFTWSDSPAILQAINAAQATITDSQIKSWITQAQRSYWTAQNAGTPTEADLTGTGYDTAYLVPYLAVNATFWNETGVLNATLTPSYRIEVRSTLSGTDDNVVVNGKLGQHDPIVVKAGTTLGALTGEMYRTTYSSTSGTTTTTISGAPTVKFNLGAAFNSLWMHQDSTYAYAGNNGEWTITHAGANGLGTIVLNDTEPTVTLNNPLSITHTDNGDTATLVGGPVFKYSSLQAAVDDAKHLGEITIAPQYTGSTAITVTGAARTITIKAQGNHVVTSNASGVVVTPDSTGHNYTVQLVADTTATGNVVISAANVTNGNVTLSTTRAAANSTVTITANPASGYSVRQITAKTNTGANVPVTATSTANRYTFVVPAGATSVTVTPEFGVAGQASITVAAVANGSAVTNASGNVAQTNSTVTVTTTPNANYRTLGVTARTNTGANVPVSRSGNNVYYFTVPANATSITVTPSFDLDTGMPFVDVLSTEFYLPYVQFVYKNGMMSGAEPTIFDGESPITRGQLVAILWRQQNSPAAATYAGFVDVPTNEYYASAITWAKNNNIVNGTSATTFEPDRAINRQEFATILYNFNNYLGKSTSNQKNLSSYTDNGYVESWAKTAMQWCVGNGIIGGDTPTTLSPYGTATRYQGATMLTRYCQNFLGMK